MATGVAALASFVLRVEVRAADYPSMSKERPERAKDKLIVRWLPSKLTEEEFRLSVGRWQESITWLRFEAGTVPEGVGGQRHSDRRRRLQIAAI